MEEKVIFITENKMGIMKESEAKFLNSQHLKRYYNNMIDIKKKHAWKTEGTGAAFMGAHNPMGNFSEGNISARINGIAPVNEQEKIIYSISIDEFSGIFIKNPIDDAELEGLVTSDHNVEFLSLDYNDKSERIAVAVREHFLEEHIAVMTLKSGGYNVLTEGESIDRNPSWSKVKEGVIYYDSAGVALSNAVGYNDVGERAIFKLDLNEGELQEIFHINKFDCIRPREDSKGNIYFIKRPYKENQRSSSSIKDVILIPFKLLKAVFSWMNVFTAKYTGDTLTTAGQNPAKGKQKSQEEIFIEGNLINAEKTLKENKSAGEKFPGVAPRSWELMKLKVDGEMVCIKKGVIDFDINKNDEIVYSNGKYLVKLLDDSSEETLGKINLVNKIRAL